MRLGPVEEHFTAGPVLRESTQFGIKDSANVLHVFICSNDLKSMDIASILISCVCCAALLHSYSWHNIHEGNVICFYYFLTPHLYKWNIIRWKCARKCRNEQSHTNLQWAKPNVIAREGVQLSWFAAINVSAFPSHFVHDKYVTHRQHKALWWKCFSLYSRW